MEGGLEDDRIPITLGVPDHPEWAADAVLVRAEEGWIIESVMVRPDGETIPHGGLKAVPYRAVRLSDFARELASGRTAEVVTMITGDPDAVLDLHRMPRNLDRPGRAGRDDAEYVGWAVESPPGVRDLHPTGRGSRRSSRPLTVEHPRCAQRGAQRDLLTRTRVKGRPGGELTPKAIQLLKETSE